MSEISKRTQELKDRIQALRDLNNSFTSGPLDFETSPSNSLLNSSPRSEEEEDLSFPFIFNLDLDTIADRDIIPVGAPMALKNAFIPTTPESPSCIAFIPPDEANFSIPVQLLGQLPKYSGSSMEDPNVHLREFLDICKLQSIHHLSQEGLRLLLFPFTLKDDAKRWLYSLPAGIITTWDEMTRKFLKQFSLLNSRKD